ncbi:MAG TPA: carboxypeptidase-like regulatory domain-containing protein [Gemmatimonadaceae bacterium]|nr:carboxypeptidase-like regulatory domain-containing protein [Gemmatimonadaceae bacterium]
MRGGYLKDAVVAVEGTSLTATTDSLGRFRIDNVPEGLRSLRIAHPLLDTLGIAVVTPKQQVRKGEAFSFIVAVPSPATIVKARCPADQRAKGAGALVGVVVDADTEMPSGGANVIVAWTDIALGGRKETQRTIQTRVGMVRADGTYLVCGIPDDLTTGVYASRGADTTAAVVVSFDRILGIQNFYIPEPSKAPDLIPSTDPQLYFRPKGSATLMGLVRDPAGKPLPAARVLVEADDAAALTGPDGRFTLRGVRSGTRLLSVRKVGFEPMEMTVVASTRVASELSIRIGNALQTLQTVEVIGTRDIGLARAGFTVRQRLGSGKFYTPRDIETRNPLTLNALLESAPMLRSAVDRNGKRMITARGYQPCLRYYIDGTLTAEYAPSQLDMLPDSYLSTAEIAAVEVYDNRSTPAEFSAVSRSGQVCSVVVIWTKFHVGTR